MKRGYQKERNDRKGAYARAAKIAASPAHHAVIEGMRAALAANARKTRPLSVHRVAELLEPKLAEKGVHYTVRTIESISKKAGLV